MTEAYVQNIKIADLTLALNPESYTHQFKNGCRRMDIFPMAVLYWLYKRDGIIWPEIDGKPSLKLEHLSDANRLVSGQSHEAMVDVEATVELARRILSRVHSSSASLAWRIRRCAPRTGSSKPATARGRHRPIAITTAGP